MLTGAGGRIRVERVKLMERDLNVKLRICDFCFVISDLWYDYIVYVFLFRPKFCSI